MYVDTMVILKELMANTNNRKRPRRRPRQKWIDIVTSDLEKCTPGLKLKESEDRESWREII